MKTADSSRRLFLPSRQQRFGAALIWSTFLRHKNKKKKKMQNQKRGRGFTICVHVLSDWQLRWVALIFFLVDSIFYYTAPLWLTVRRGLWRSVRLIKNASFNLQHLIEWLVSNICCLLLMHTPLHVFILCTAPMGRLELMVGTCQLRSTDGAQRPHQLQIATNFSERKLFSPLLLFTSIAKEERFFKKKNRWLIFE